MSRTLLTLALAPLLGLFILGIGNGYLATLITLRLDAIGASAFTIGAVSSAYFLGLAAGALINDRLLLRIGHIRAYGAFASLVAASVLMQGLIKDPWAWFGLRLIGGWASVGVFLVIESWLLSSAESHKRGRLLALYMISLYAAGVIGQLLLGVLDEMGQSAPFIVVGVLASLSVLPMTMIPRASPDLELAEPLSPIRLAMITPTGVMASLGSGMAVAVAYTLLPLYLQRHGMNVAQVGQMMAIVVLGAMLLQYPIGRWSDRHDRQSVLLMISLVILLISAAMLWLPLSYSLMAALLFMLGGGVFALYPVAISHSADRTPAAALVGMSQGLLLINSLGAAFSPVLVSGLINRVGDSGLFWALGVGALAFMLFFSWRRSVRPAPLPVAPFSSTAPLSAAGAELVVTEELVQGAKEHEYREDLSGGFPGVEVAEAIEGPPPEDAEHIRYYLENDYLENDYLEKESMASEPDNTASERQGH